MALRDLPYLPLYIQDYLTDEKLNRCSAAAQGVYIKMMCIFHKSEPYGGILLKQKDKQNESTSLNFAYVFAKLLPFDLQQIHDAILELLDEKVLRIDGDFLFQKRMVEDNKLSEIRSLAGKKGGKKTQSKTKDFTNDFAKAKIKANTEDENEYEIKDSNWKSSFEIYLNELNEVYNELITDQNFIQEQERFNPGVDISLSLEKAKANFWGKEAGWKHKKKSRTKTIDWKQTFINAIPLNKVPKKYGPTNQTSYRPDKNAETIRAAENLQRELAAESRKQT